MKYSILLTILFLTCNDTSNTTNTIKSDDFVDKRKSTIEEVVRDGFFKPSGVWSEQTAFFHDFNEEILKTYRIVEVETFKEKYNFVFVDFTVGARVFREVISVIKIYDGKYI